jgi:hypothetical protein
MSEIKLNARQLDVLIELRRAGGRGRRKCRPLSKEKNYNA